MHFQSASRKKTEWEQYIRSQKEHHQQLSFQDELRGTFDGNTESHLTNDMCGIDAEQNVLHNPFGVDGTGEAPVP